MAEKRMHLEFKQYIKKDGKWVFLMESMPCSNLIPDVEAHPLSVVNYDGTLFHAIGVPYTDKEVIDEHMELIFSLVLPADASFMFSHKIKSMGDNSTVLIYCHETLGTIPPSSSVLATLGAVIDNLNKVFEEQIDVERLGKLSETLVLSVSDN